MLPKSDLTNKYLYHAQRLLSVLSDTDLNKSAELAITLCLKSALESWLEELVDYVHSQKPVNTALKMFFSQTESDIPDVQHLINLKQQPNTWLSQLLYRLVQLEDLNAVSVADSSTNQSSEIQNLIPTTSVEAVDDSLSFVISGFKEYVVQVRSQHVEW